METMQAIPDWKKTADEIWAVLKETSKGFEEIRRGHAETEAIVKETVKGLREIRKGHAETEAIVKETVKGLREIRKSHAETEAIVKETTKENAKLIGRFGNRYGEMIEHMVLPNLITKFNKLNLPFTRAHRNTKIEDAANNIFAEVDAFLENGDKVMIVEIKSKPGSDDINEHIERMEKLRRYADLHNDRRKYMGAIAGMVFGDDEKKYALKKGFYVIEPSGETLNITAPYGPPREW